MKIFILCVCVASLVGLGTFAIWYRWQEAKTCEATGSSYVRVWSTTQPFVNEWSCIKLPK